MLNTSKEINSLSNFKRNTAEFIEQLRETGQPIVLTVNGKAELVVQDIESYQKLLELVQRLVHEYPRLILNAQCPMPQYPTM